VGVRRVGAGGPHGRSGLHDSQRGVADARAELHASESICSGSRPGICWSCGGDAALGLLGDRYGRKKVLLASLALFAVARRRVRLRRPRRVHRVSPVARDRWCGLVVMGSRRCRDVQRGGAPAAVGSWRQRLSYPCRSVRSSALAFDARLVGWVFLINVPVAVVALIATVTLVPASRAHERPGGSVGWPVDRRAGRVDLRLIQAGQHGWSSAGALQRWWAASQCSLPSSSGGPTAQPSGGQPLLDLALFRSRSYTWGVILSAIAIFAMFGVLFTMPSTSRSARTSPMSSGLRLLPMIGGLVLAAVPRSHRASVGEDRGRAWVRNPRRGSAARNPHERRLELSVHRGGWRWSGSDGSRSCDRDVGRAFRALRGAKRCWRRRCRRSTSSVGRWARSPRQPAQHRLPRAPRGRRPPAAASIAARQSIFGAVAVAQKIHSTALLASATPHS